MALNQRRAAPSASFAATARKVARSAAGSAAPRDRRRARVRITAPCRPSEARLATAESAPGRVDVTFVLAKPFVFLCPGRTSAGPKNESDRPAALLSTDQFERLVYRYRDRVYGFAMHYLGRPEDAADAVQDVMIRLWTHRETVDADRALGWLLRVTRNVCIDGIRRRRSERKYRTDDPDLVDDFADETPAADDEVDRGLFEARLQSAIATLGEPHRSIVIFREIQGLRYGEISEILGLPLNTVKVYLHRARRSLRHALNPVVDRETA